MFLVYVHNIKTSFKSLAGINKTKVIILTKKSLSNLESLKLENF